MAIELIWSRHALADIDAIADYIKRDSAMYVAAMVEHIYEGVQRLLLFPRGGRIVPELDDEAIRELIVRKYRVIYRIKDNTVTIAAVVHGAMLLENAIGDRTI